MFTGLVEEMGTIREITMLGDAVRLSITADTVLTDTTVGDSICVNGVCLTATDIFDDGFSADVMQESLNRSSLGDLAASSRVNLERAVSMSTRLGGHVVQGHVDDTARLLSRKPSEHWDVLRFELPANLARYVVEKGSITVSGVSLTVSEIGEDYFDVSLIPATLSATTLGDLQPGESVNLEVDILAKYVEKMLKH